MRACTQTLSRAKGYTDTQIGKVRNSMRTMSRKAFSGIAAAVAMGSAPMPSAAGKTDVSVHTGLFENYTGFGMAFSHRLNTDVPLAIDGGFAHAGQREHRPRRLLGGVLAAQRREQCAREIA